MDVLECCRRVNHRNESRDLKLNVGPGLGRSFLQGIRIRTELSASRTYSLQIPSFQIPKKERDWDGSETVAKFLYSLDDQGNREDFATALLVDENESLGEERRWRREKEKRERKKKK